MAEEERDPTSLEAFYRMVGRRPGHFQMESGLHSALWLDVDQAFAHPDSLDPALGPYVDMLAGMILGFDPEIICGPAVGGAVLAAAIARRLSIPSCAAERAGHARFTLFGATYRLSEADRMMVQGKRVALVDDVMSAGSSMRSTFSELVSSGADVRIVGALLILGSMGAEYFESFGVPVIAVNRDDFEMWRPGECPLCRKRVMLDNITA